VRQADESAFERAVAGVPCFRSAGAAKESDVRRSFGSGVVEETARPDVVYTLIPLKHLAYVKFEAQDERSKG
jgi:hypothetical protein